jgi:hypothetical protein
VIRDYPVVLEAKRVRFLFRTSPGRSSSSDRVRVKPATVVQWDRKGLPVELAVAIKMTLRGAAQGELGNP